MRAIIHHTWAVLGSKDPTKHKLGGGGEEGRSPSIKMPAIRRARTLATHAMPTAQTPWLPKTKALKAKVTETP